MNFYEIKPFKRPITATVDIPGSKSNTNRALILAALTTGPVTLHHPLYSEDTQTMLDCLRTLGLRIETLAEKIIVHDSISTIQNKAYELHANDSGTTLRFLLPLLCLIPGAKIIKGNPRLNERPLKGLVKALRSLGANIEYLQKEGHSPLKIDSFSLNFNCEITLDASASSQFLSGLLMIAPLVQGLKIHVNDLLISKPYAEMTISIMREWGIAVFQTDETVYDVPCGQHYKQGHYVIEGDYSSAGYFFAIAVLTQSTITLKNLNPYSRQADRKFLDILAQMGNHVHFEENAITVTGKQVLPCSLSMEDCPDQVQTMAVLAAFTKGVTTITGVRSLRLKETERVHALKNELAKMGIKTEDTHDTLTIYGGNPCASKIETYGDHRMAMAFAMAGTKLPGMQICCPEVVNKTFPTFWSKLKELT